MKNIIIIGGGISGLVTLHYLRGKYALREDVSIILLEASERLGGTIQTVTKDGFRFEAGANGFLSSKPETLNFIKELNLTSALCTAVSESKIRYLSVQNKLHKLPSSPVSFLGFDALSLKDRLRVPLEMFIPKGKDEDETVFEFGKRRLGENFSNLFLDAMVSGIYGGDAKRLNLKAAFPRIHEIEQTFGSLIRGMLKLRTSPEPKGELTSFQNGMSQIIQTLAERYRNFIQTSQSVQHVERNQNQFIVRTIEKTFPADEIYCCTPAFVAAKIFEHLNAELSAALLGVEYAPIAVVGFGFAKKDLKKFPEGFGYLIPSKERKKVLGVLFDSNVFPNRAPQDSVFIRVMVGGMRHQEIATKSKDEIIAIAREEINLMVKPVAEPRAVFFSSWPKGIPQYNTGYLQLKEKIESETTKLSGVFLVSNYLNGVAFNDCIASAKRASEKSRL